MTPAPEQPPLPLSWQPRMGAKDYCLSNSNRIAHAWLAEPAAWPMPRTILVGPEASGKSHLARLFAARNAGMVIEDADRADDAEMLFHHWNRATVDQPLLLTARLLPRQWPHELPDLASRLAATPLVRLELPDDALVAAVLAKRFGDHGLRVGDDVIAWLMARIERSFAGIEATVARLDAAALAERREITVPLARAVFETQWSLDV